jgi:uncharacterized protein YvpB
MPLQSSAVTIYHDQATSLPRSLTRRRLLKGGALVVASFLLPSLPAHAASERRLLPVPFHYQQHTLTCEIATLRMAAEYHGHFWSEDALLKLLPRDERQPRYESGSVVWADPNIAFPGNFRGWQLYHGGWAKHPERARSGQWGYGIHAPAIANLAVRIGLAAELFDRVEAVYDAVDADHVPIVIVPDGGRDQAVKWQWHTPRGKPVDVINAEHSVVVRGYSEQTVWVHDPKGKVWSYPRDRFERAFALLGSGVAIGPTYIVIPWPFIPY